MANTQSQEALSLAKSLPILVQSTLHLLTAAALTVHLLPFLHTRFLPYGKARTTSPTSKITPKAKPNTPLLLRPLDFLANITVPKSWFSHYYALLLTCTLWWSMQLLQKSPFLVLVLEAPTPEILRWGGYLDTLVSKARKGAGGKSTEGMWITIVGVLLQATRRLYESTMLAVEGKRLREARKRTTDGKGNGEIVKLKEGRRDDSRMHLGIYVFGMLFYVLLSIAVWADSASIILESPAPQLPGLSLEVYDLPMMSIRTMLAVPTFLILSGSQYDLHLYLASQEKYSLAPPFGYFGYILCPHYLVEIGIYLSLAVLRSGFTINGCMGAILLFVATNLTLQGRESKLWYERTFGKENVGGRGGVWPWY